MSKQILKIVVEERVQVLMLKGNENEVATGLQLFYENNPTVKVEQMLCTNFVEQAGQFELTKGQFRPVIVVYLVCRITEPIVGALTMEERAEADKKQIRAKLDVN